VLNHAGQSGAGKSTLLKNFQLLFAPKAFEAEAEAWRAVVHYNLVRAVNFILEVLSPSSSDATSSPVTRSQSSLSHHSSSKPSQSSLDPVRAIRMRLSPLRQVELILHARIAHSPGAPSDGSDNFNAYALPSADGRPLETSLRARSGWKALARLKRPTSSTQDDLQDIRQVLDACNDDIVALWLDMQVHEELRKRLVILEDSHIL
jgi:guanine nucleotide-binding protein G(i) subunit alpha